MQESNEPRTKLIVKLRNNILGAGLWAIAAGASALSLGASRGAVVLGSSLDLTFDVQPDTGSDVASSCVAATVKSGDAQLSESKVFVTPLPETSGRTGVRVQASVAIDEPIVQVTLTAGCAGRVTRTYIFLQTLRRRHRAALQFLGRKGR